MTENNEQMFEENIIIPTDLTTEADEPEAEVTEDLPTEEPTETLDPEESGCRAFGDTVLTFPALAEKPFLDYRAEVVQNCHRHQPSKMELEEAEEAAQ